MLFSDIEGSTRLLSNLGESYADAIAAQRELMRAAIQDSRGEEMGTEGDSFFVVFESAGDAITCCVAAQRALAGHQWPGGAAVKVRMGLHSGEPSRYEDGYIGMDVHRAARIAACAHGGQVILSEVTRQLVEARLPPGVSVRDLGWHRLKDIDAPERIYQVIAPGLADQFAPLKSLGAPSSLPEPMTPLVGRLDELELLRALLVEAPVRLVTLTGTGGVGKTRLALATAASVDIDFPGGVYFVDLADVRDADVMWKTIAGELNIAADQSVADEVAEHLRTSKTLLVLDNLEQLPDAGIVVAQLLSSTRSLKVLATSRRPLHVRGEHERPVLPLPIPQGTGAGEVAASPAARLFVQHAEMVRPGFAVTEDNSASVAAICSRLDGLPLAIELAAARVRLLAPKAIADRLDQSLGLAAGDLGRPSRQQTLRKTIEWSHDLLTPGLARVFRLMGIFAGGCDLAALQAVASTDGQEVSDPLQELTGLLDVSLITVSEGPDGEPRAGMLSTIHQYALEQLESSGEADDARRRHGEYYAALAEQTCAGLRGPGHLASLDRLDAERENLSAALRWALDAAARRASDDEHIEVGLRLVQALAPFWYQHGHATEGRSWLTQAVRLAAGRADATSARLLHWLGVLLQQQGENAEALQRFESSQAIWRELGSRDQEARELNSLGITHRHLGHAGTARSLLEESVTIARQIGDNLILAAALTNLAQVESAAGDFDRATQLLEEALEFNAARGDSLGAAISRQSLAVIRLRADRAEEARLLLLEILPDVVSSGDAEFLATTLELLAAVCACTGDQRRAGRLAGATQTIREIAAMPIPEPDAALLETFLGPAAATIGPQAWAAELAAGQALSQDEAIELATAGC